MTACRRGHLGVDGFVALEVSNGFGALKERHDNKFRGTLFRIEISEVSILQFEIFLP